VIPPKEHPPFASGKHRDSGTKIILAEAHLPDALWDWGGQLTELQDTLLKLRNDPEMFVRHVIGAEPQKWQTDALRAIASNDKVAIKSGHGVGKTAFLSWLVLWWLLTRYPTKIVATANTAHQLNDILWTEVDKWARKMPEGFRSQLEFTKDKISLSGSSDSFCAFRVSRRENPESLQGFHSDNMLIVVDEASGVPDVVFQVGEGAMSTPNAKTVLTGNPTRATGFFYDAFHSNREHFKCMTVSCKDADTVDPKFVDEMVAKYGPDSNITKVRVHGEFPTQSDDVLLPLHLVEDATKRDIESSPTTPVVWGLDVARFGGDRSALCKRQGQVVLEPCKTWQGKDLMELAGIILTEYEATTYTLRPTSIFIDAIGVGGGLADRLAELGLPAVSISVSESPSLKDKFTRLRDELFWNAREWFEARDCKIPNDETLISEVTSVRYKYQSTGKLKIESKDEMKRRGQRSPDVADAFILTFSLDGATALGGVSRWNNKGSVKPDMRWVV